MRNPTPLVLAIGLATAACSPPPATTADPSGGAWPDAAASSDPVDVPREPLHFEATNDFCKCYRSFSQLPEQADACAGLSKSELEEGVIDECARGPNDPATDCQGYRECFTMEPSATATCLDNEIFSGPCASCRCSMKCDIKSPACPPEHECTLENTHVEGQAWCAPT